MGGLYPANAGHMMQTQAPTLPDGALLFFLQYGICSSDDLPCHGVCKFLEECRLLHY